MKQSKLLKKSLAALLAILMVAAMIPMSAFAAEEPAKGVNISVGSADAVWKDDAYRVSGSSTIADDGSLATTISWAPVANTTIKVVETNTTLNSSKQALDLTKAKTKPVDNGTGDYTFTLSVKVGDAEAVEVPLIISWTVNQKSSVATIKSVKASGNILKGTVGNDTITMQMKLSVADLTNVSETVTLNSDTYTINMNGGSEGVTASDSPTDDDKSNALKQIFDVTDSTAKLSLTAAGLVVKAQNGDTKTYSLAFEYEPYFTDFTFGGVAGKIEGKTITVELPYIADVDADALAQKAYSWTGATSDIKVWDSQTAAVEVPTSGKGLVFNAGTENTTAHTKTFELTKAADAAKADLKVETKNVAKADAVSITLKVVVPTQNPDAKLTAIKIGTNGQKFPIPEHEDDGSVVNVNVKLPTGQTLTDAQNITVYGAANSKVELARDKSSTNRFGASDSAPGNVGAASNQTIDFSKGYILLDVTSKSGHAIRYRVNISTSTATATSLDSVSLQDSEGKTVGTVEKTTTSGTTKFTITVPYSKASTQAMVQGYKVIATASDNASIAWGAAGNPTTAFTSGDLVSAGFGSINIDGSTGAITNGTAEMRVWHSGTNATNATSKTDYTIEIKRGDANDKAEITSAEMTTETAKDTMTADNTLSASVDPKTNTITVDVPYSMSKDGNNKKTSLYFSKLGISDGAVITPKLTAPSKGDTIVMSAKGMDLPNDTVNGDAIDVSVPTDTHAWEGDTAIELWVFSEENWGTASAMTIKDADETAASDKHMSDLEGLYTVYKLKAKVATPQTGAELLSMASTLDEKVSAVKDDATRTITITVPKSYVDKNTEFTLNFETSPLATVKAGPSSATVTLTSDKGSADTKTATKFKVVNNNLQAGGTDITASNKGVLVVSAEKKGGDTKQWTVKLAQFAAETDSSVKAVVAAKTASVADTEDATILNLTLPYGTLLEQVLDIQASKLATVYVDGVAFDKEKAYDLSKDIKIRVVAEDGSTETTYTLKTTVGDPSTEAEITAAKVGEVDAAVAGETITAVVPKDFDFTQAVAVSFTVSEGAKVTKLGEAAPTATYTFTDGEPVAVEVTAQDGETTKTYQLIVTTKQPSSENAITELTVDGAAATAGEENTFTAEADDPANVTLDIKVSEGATVTVNGEEYTAGDAIDATEPVTIVVTAEDGTEATYTLTVTKKADKPTMDDVKDVPADHWAVDAIANVVDKSIMTPNSKGEFRPNETVSRAQFATMMCALNGVNPDEYANASNPYTDVKENAWYYKYVMAAVANKWMSGTSSTTFEPNEPVTREQTALIIGKAQGLTEVETPAEAYSDDASIANWAKGWVYACKDANWISYMSASQKTFNPKGELTRAQMAVILTRVTSETPEEPSDPENPEEPSDPENPEEPTDPENPEEPTDPENPEEPTDPENPEEPTDPENPEEPTDPETPETPTEPETPAE